MIRPEKKLTKILKKHSGRDNTGKISIRHRGGRHKRYYRVIDFKRDKLDETGTVVGIEYDPNRNADIAKIEYKNKEKRYILHPKGLNIGDKILYSLKAEIKVGNTLPVGNIPIGIEIHNLELYPGRGGVVVRGAGNSAVIVAKEEKYTHIKLPSGEIRKFFNECLATVGAISKEEFKMRILGTAGRKRRMGIRPTVRGTAQNPRSHPHGGGEGKSGEGMHPKTPWGKSARGTRTRNKKKPSSKLIVKRRN